MKHFFIFITILFASLFAPAQQAPLWKATIPEAILWQKITPLGTLVVATSKGLYGIDPSTGQMAWSQNNAAVADIPESNYEVVNNTPFVAIVSGGTSPQQVILNSANGKIVCSSRDAGLAMVVSRYILYETGNILLYGVASGFQPVVVVFDISTGNIKWQKTNLFGKGFLAEKIQGKPLEDGAESFIVATTGGVYKVSTATGDIVWKQPLPKMGVQSTTQTEAKLLRSVRPDEFYYLFNMYAMSYKLSDGSQRWKAPARQSGLTDRVIFDPDGLIIASAADPNNNIVKPKLSMFDYETGTEKWEKGAKLNGTVTNYSYCKKGLIVAMQSQAGDYTINIVNLATGEFTLDKPLKVKGRLEEIRLTEKGVLYLTTNEINILNLTTGEPVFAKSIKAGEDQEVLRTENDNIIYAFSTSDATLYKVDADAGTMSALANGIKFDDNEIPSAIETNEKGILLSSSQNMTLFDFSGKQVYHVFYPAPQISNFAKVVYGISATLHSYDALRYGAASAAFSGAAANESDPGYHAMYAGFGDLCNQVSDASMNAAKAEMDMIRKRYNATAAANNFLFMNTKLDKGVFGLVKINKATGAKESELAFGTDKEPDYQIDDIASLLFYRSLPNEISCFKF